VLGNGDAGVAAGIASSSKTTTNVNVKSASGTTTFDLLAIGPA
jgi:uncharacterized protein YraI